MSTVDQEWPFPVSTDEEPNYRLIIKAGDVPLGATVTKRTGRRPYKLGDKLVVYGLKSDAPRELKAESGVLFLISEGGTANAIPADTEVVWECSAEELRMMLDPPDDQ